MPRSNVGVQYIDVDAVQDSDYDWGGDYDEMTMIWRRIRILLMMMMMMKLRL